MDRDGDRAQRQRHRALAAGRITSWLVRPARPDFETGRRRNREHPSIVRAHDLPTAFVHHPVMPVAEKGEVRKVAGTVLNPVHKVMPFSHAHRPVASRPGTTTV